MKDDLRRAGSEIAIGQGTKLLGHEGFDARPRRDNHDLEALCRHEIRETFNACHSPVRL